MPTYGLTFDGFATKTLAVIRDELNGALREAFGNSIDLGDRSVFGQIVGIIAERMANLWELAEAVNASQDPDKASGAALDALATLSGTFRPTATFSAVPLVLTGSPTTLVAQNSQVATQSTAKAFQTSVDATIVAVSAWVINTPYLVGVRVTNGGNVYQCITAGTSASSGGPTTADADITDNTAHWTYLGAGTGAIDVTGTAVESGAIQGFARDINQIVTNVGGWDSVINLLDADPGREVASDLELRVLREAELGGLGSSTVDALRAKLLAVDEVKSVTVFENITDITDADGMPPHSVECLVRGPEIPTSAFDQTIRDLLLTNVATGIQTTGTISGTSTDSQSVAHTIKFSRPTDIPVYAYLILSKNAKFYPTDGDQLIKEAIVAWGDAQDTGKDVVPTALVAQAFTVPGVLIVDYVAVSTSAIATPTFWIATTAYSIGNTVLSAGRFYRCTTGGTSGSTAPSGIGTGITDGSVVWAHLGELIPVSLRELAIYDTSRITVSSLSTVTP